MTRREQITLSDKITRASFIFFSVKYGEFWHGDRGFPIVLLEARPLPRRSCKWIIFPVA